MLVVFAWADFARLENELVIAGDAVMFCQAGDEPPMELASRTIYPIAFQGAAKNVMAIAMVERARSEATYGFRQLAQSLPIVWPAQ